MGRGSGSPFSLWTRTWFFVKTLFSFTNLRIFHSGWQFVTVCKTALHGYKKSAGDQAHDTWRLELGKVKHTTFFSETLCVLTNNLRCFDETDVRTSQKTTYAQFKIHVYRTNFIDEIGPRTVRAFRAAYIVPE